jgi:hypothetical protein
MNTRFSDDKEIEANLENFYHSLLLLSCLFPGSKPYSLNTGHYHSLGSSVTAVFGPQHGFHQTEQDNMIETPDLTYTFSDGVSLPLFSLYSQVSVYARVVVLSSCNSCRPENRPRFNFSW